MIGAVMDAVALKWAMAEQLQVVKQFIHRINEIVAELVAEGIAAGEFRRQDPVLAARCAHKAFIAFIHPDLVVQCLDEPDRIEPEQQVDFFLRGLLA